MHDRTVVPPLLFTTWLLHFWVVPNDRERAPTTTMLSFCSGHTHTHTQPLGHFSYLNNVFSRVVCEKNQKNQIKFHTGHTHTHRHRQTHAQQKSVFVVYVVWKSLLLCRNFYFIFFRGVSFSFLPVGEFLCETKIGDFQMSVAVEEEILRFQVPVNDVLRVKVVEGANDFARVEIALKTREREIHKIIIWIRR